MSDMGIVITIDGEPADVKTLSTFEDALDARITALDAAYVMVVDLGIGAKAEDSVREAAVAEHDRLVRLRNGVYSAKARLVFAETYGSKP